MRAQRKEGLASRGSLPRKAPRRSSNEGGGSLRKARKVTSRRARFSPPGAATLAVHAGELRPAVAGAIAMPLWSSATYELGAAQRYDDIRYVRLNNTPNQEAVAAKLAALEGCEAALVLPSGTAAVSFALAALLRPGDHLLVQRGVYGGTRKVLEHLRATMGIEASYVEGERPETWAAALRPQTRAFYVDSLTNPWLEIADHAAVVDFARRRALVSIVDNTMASPINFQPRLLGFDYVLHSASKYLNGHSDVVAGVIASSREAIERLRVFVNRAGVCLDPHACHLLQRGLKTLPLRMEAHNRSAAQLAARLERHPALRRLRYPGLASHPQAARAAALFRGFGGVLTFRLRSEAAAKAFVGRLRWAREAPGFGGAETLVCRPATSSHAGLSASLRRALEVGGEVVRLAVGLESSEDLIDDVLSALEA